MMKTIELKGIFRNTRGIKPLGTMTDLTNLRFKNGVLEPVGDKQLVDTFSNEVARHLGVHVISATQKNYIYQASGGQVGARINGSDINITGALVNPRVSFVNNVLVVFSDNEDMLYYVYKDGLYNNVKTKIKDFDLKWHGVEYVKHSLDPAMFRSMGNIVSDVPDDHNNEYDLGLISKARADCEKEGVFIGPTWYCYTIVLFDGTEIMHSQPRAITPANMAYGLGTLVHGITKILSVAPFSAKPPAGITLKDVGEDGVAIHRGTFINSSNLFSAINYSYLSANPDLFKEVRVYAVRPPAIHEVYSDVTTPFYNTLNTDTTRYNIESYNQIRWVPREFVDSDIFRLIGSIQVANLKDWQQLEIPPLDTIDSLPVLPIDNNTHISITSLNPTIVFNNRIILSNIKNTLPEVSSLHDFKHYHFSVSHDSKGKPYTLMFEGKEATWTSQQKADYTGLLATNKKYGESDQMWDGAKWVPVTTNSEHPRLLHNWQLFFEVTVVAGLAEVKARSKIINFDECRYRDGKKVFIVNTLFSYPSSSASKVKVYVRDTLAPADAWFTKEIRLSSSDTNNYAFTELNIAFYAYSENVTQNTETITYSPRTDGYTDQNRVQASEPNNPFIFPAKNSYRVGHAAISRLSTVTEALSQGQFGQYPLVAFTDAGIWSLEIGSGDVFVSRVVPLANELSINADMITSIQGGIFFVTNEGLKVLSGSSVADISDPVEGKPGNTIYNHPGMVVPVAHRAVEDFKQYLKSAQAGYDYDNNEIIISKPGAPHSYAYSFDTKTWTMITQAYTGFINQFPHNYALAGNKMYELSKETTASKAVSFCTNYFGDHSFSKLIEGALRGQFDNATVQVYGSADGAQFALLCTRKATQAHSIMIPRLPYSLKYYIIAFHSTTSDQDYISHLEINTESRYAHKLR